jgi:hypothetical protein
MPFTLAIPQTMTESIGKEPTTLLSPATQAILDAYGDFEAADADAMAAALRAAADQVAPSDAMEPRNYLPVAIECQRIRAELLAIAAELETLND